MNRWTSTEESGSLGSFIEPAGRGAFVVLDEGVIDLHALLVDDVEDDLPSFTAWAEEADLHDLTEALLTVEAPGRRRRKATPHEHLLIEQGLRRCQKGTCGHAGCEVREDVTGLGLFAPYIQGDEAKRRRKVGDALRQAYQPAEVDDLDDDEDDAFGCVEKLIVVAEGLTKSGDPHARKLASFMLDGAIKPLLALAQRQRMSTNASLGVYA